MSDKVFFSLLGTLGDEIWPMTFGLCGSFNGGRFRSLFHQVAQAEMRWPNKGSEEGGAGHERLTWTFHFSVARAVKAEPADWLEPFLYLQLCFFLCFSFFFYSDLPPVPPRFSPLMGFRQRNDLAVCAKRPDYNLSSGNVLSNKHFSFSPSAVVHFPNTAGACCEWWGHFNTTIEKTL